MLPMGLGKSPDYFQMARELLVAPTSTDIEYAEILALEINGELGNECELCGSHTHSLNYHHQELFEDC